MGIYKDAQSFGRISTYIAGIFFIIISIILIIFGIRSLSWANKATKPDEKKGRKSLGETLIISGVVLLLFSVLAIYLVNKFKFAAAGAGAAAILDIF